VSAVVAEESDFAGPSDFIFTRGNPDEAEEDEGDSDTDDIDHNRECRAAPGAGLEPLLLNAGVRRVSNRTI